MRGNKINMIKLKVVDYDLYVSIKNRVEELEIRSEVSDNEDEALKWEEVEHVEKLDDILDVKNNIVLEYMSFSEFPVVYVVYNKDTFALLYYYIIIDNKQKETRVEVSVDGEKERLVSLLDKKIQVVKNDNGKELHMEEIKDIFNDKRVIRLKLKQQG